MFVAYKYWKCLYVEAVFSRNGGRGGGEEGVDGSLS